MNKTRIFMVLTLTIACLGIISMVTVSAFNRESSQYDSLKSMNLIFTEGNVSSANGSGHNGNLTLSFGAFDHGESNITGQATFIDALAKTRVTINVECLITKGFNASIGGIVQKSTNPSFISGNEVNFHVQDFGEGVGAMPDMFTPFLLGPCGSAGIADLLTSENGNIQIRFFAPDKDCQKCPEGTHCAGNGECAGGGGLTHCKVGYRDCCGNCVPEDGAVCPACPENLKL